MYLGTQHIAINLLDVSECKKPWYFIKHKPLGPFKYTFHFQGICFSRIFLNLLYKHHNTNIYKTVCEMGHHVVVVMVVEGEIAIFAHKRCVRFSSCDHIQRVSHPSIGRRKKLVFSRSTYRQSVTQYYLVAFPYDIYVAILNNNDDDDSFLQM